jgi:hypothetical protein
MAVRSVSGLSGVTLPADPWLDRFARRTTLPDTATAGSLKQ